MRNALEWAQSLDGANYVDDDSGWQVEKIADLIGEAQAEGVTEGFRACEVMLHLASDSLENVTRRALGFKQDALKWERLYVDLVERYAALHPEVE